MTLLKSITEFLFPSYCAVCGRRHVAGESVVCLHCNLELPRTYLWNNALKNTLTERLYGNLSIRKGASYIYHHPDTKTANIIYSMKYHNRPDIAQCIGEMMAEEIAPSGFFDDIDYIIPVPISKKRRKERGYNQCEELAKGITKHVDIPVATTVLKRKEGIETQTRQTVIGRRDNIEGAFYATDNAMILKGKHCLLLDDIITTGSTLIECGKMLSHVPGISFSILSYGCIG